MSEREYDAMRDFWESWWLAIRIKRERGDQHWPQPAPKDERAA